MTSVFKRYSGKFCRKTACRLFRVNYAGPSQERAPVTDEIEKYAKGRSPYTVGISLYTFTFSLASHTCGGQNANASLPPRQSIRGYHSSRGGHDPRRVLRPGLAWPPRHSTRGNGISATGGSDPRFTSRLSLAADIIPSYQKFSKGYS